MINKADGRNGHALRDEFKCERTACAIGVDRIPHGLHRREGYSKREPSFMPGMK